MADFDKLDKAQQSQGPTNVRRKIEPTTRSTAQKTKTLIIRMDPDSHLELRKQSLDEDRSMQNIVEGLIMDYLNQEEGLCPT